MLVQKSQQAWSYVIDLLKGMKLYHQIGRTLVH
jgi:hypothetical protein